MYTLTVLNFVDEHCKIVTEISKNKKKKYTRGILLERILQLLGKN